jgi:hypothetical protein
MKRSLQAREVERLNDVVQHPTLHRLLKRSDVPISGHHDDVNR